MRRLFAYQDQLRLIPASDLGAEIGRLNAALAQANAAALAAGTAGVTGAPSAAANVNVTALSLELVLALGQTRNPADTVRALALLDPLLRTPNGDSPLPWRSLARLLQQRLSEQRRLEEQLDRTNAQLRDSQRNVQQLNEKLEALKAIERSLNNRGAAPAPAASRP